MARGSLIRRFARWHIWLGWLAAIPLVLWTLSGLFMTLRPIDEVRGTALRAEAGPLDASRLVLPILTSPVSKLSLVSEVGQPVWVVAFGHHDLARYSAANGKLLGPVERIEAQQLAEAAFAGEAKPTQIRRFAADQAPLDLRKDRPSWQATFADETHVYIDADTGEVLALRTRFWRAFDFMWGLHIMDPMGRENTSHVLLWLLSGVALVSCLLGTTLLFRRRRKLS
ncbi:MAG: PepSY domain-containing protein [Novosphingobium sp.]